MGAVLSPLQVMVMWNWLENESEGAQMRPKTKERVSDIWHYKGATPVELENAP